MDDPLPRTEAPLLVPGRTCWRIERAERMAFLVDGAAYFAAVREALANAERSILVLGWDIDSRLALVPGGANDGWPEPLGDFLDALVRKRRTLRAHVLSWDFAMLFALEREWMPVYKLDRRTHRRLKFRLDAVHPLGASHHQKIVVVDDRVAFCGGLDLTKRRWDTPEHRIDEPLRRDPAGKPYDAFHDIQAAVDGDAARALGELARMRWFDATGERLAPPPPVARDPWPRRVVSDLGPVEVAISRTMPALPDGLSPAKRRAPPDADRSVAIEEIRALTLEIIARAQRTIFIEQQYFTSSATADALVRRLREPDGPEVVLVMSRVQCGWLEERTMGVLRARLDRQLREADVHGRYRMYAACRSSDDEQCIHIHSKLMIVDDAFLTVGSANLSNRSMGLDTECNLSFEARGDARRADAIRALRETLLAEHLGATREEVAAATARHPTLIAAIDSLATRERKLVRFEVPLSPEFDALVPADAVVDMERPVEPSQLVGELVEPDAAPGIRRRVATLALAALLLAGAMVAWRYTPLRELASAGEIVGWANELRHSGWAMAAVIAAYLLGGLVAFPITLLIAATGLVFGPWLGIALAVPATMASAALGYFAGSAIGRDTVRRFAGHRLNRVSRRLGERGLLAVVMVRLLPLAPFAVINVVAGASRLGWRPFMLGTLLAMSPGIVLMVLLVDRALAAVRDPSPLTFAVLALLAALVVGASVALARWLARRDRGRARPPGHALSP